MMAESVHPRMSSSADGRVVLETSLSSLANTIVDLSSTARPGLFRLIICARCVEDTVLRVEEYSDISLFPYAAISYAWKRNPVDPDSTTNAIFFSVKGAEDGDPINIDVLQHACKAALLEGATHVWLDRLCIMQTSRDDKAWQIARMYDVYRLCRVCIVLPGGVGRLVSEEEETGWVARAWTLQEATAPRRVVVLFYWDRGAGEWEGWQGGAKGRVVEVVPKQSAMMSLLDILKACYYPMALTWTPADGSETRDDVSPSIIGLYGASSVAALLWTLQMDEPEARTVAIWQSALLRTSSRPVDMVLSIMGMFGVALDARQFHKNDRIGATIALAQEILRQGGKPTWLAMALDMPPSRFLSSFPDFPVTSVQGEVHWDARQRPINPTVSDDIYDIDDLNEISDDGIEEGVDGYDVLLPNFWIEHMPGGSIDNDGYLIITSRAVPAYFTGVVFGRRRTNLTKNNDGSDDLGQHPEHTIRIVGTDGRVWDVPTVSDASSAPNRLQEGRKSSSGAFIVYMGRAHKFPRDSVFQHDPRPFGGIILPEISPLRACAVEEHVPGRFHRSSAFTLPEEPFRNIVMQWKEQTFAIGGPEPLPPGTRRGTSSTGIVNLNPQTLARDADGTATESQ